MKPFLIFLTLLLFTCTTGPTSTTNNSRQREFVVYDNGLIYDVNTMSKLRKTVDSLNLRFKTCTPKNYRSLEQGRGTYIVIKGDLAGARNAMLQNISLENFLRNRKASEVKRNLWIVKQHSTQEGQAVIEYNSEDGEYESMDFPDMPHYDKTEGWLWDEFEDELRIFYLYGLKSTVLPVEYARLIQYVDCMVDTMTTISPKETIPDSIAYTLAPDSKVKAFVDLATDFEPEPREPEFENDEVKRRELYKQYDAAMEDWDARRLASLDKKMQDPANVTLLAEAVDESIANQNGLFMDVYAERYLSPEKALALKRSFRVYGYCSADQGPRKHALAISKLAAESFQWDIFVRAHLDILTDNVLRLGDGMWAWSMRETYIKELEELNINAADLLIGTILKSQNVSNNHYQAETSRIGKALSESKYKVKVEDRLLMMVEDDHLDLYNRMEMAYIFIFCNRHAKDKHVYANNLERINKAIRSLPH